eukprot:TRINITY_DN7978_c0_g1_i1.p1 TRINITY_DN7978_c0_g1~~TRINITY_DN7978_c0_g1_i1.p1  ORF type:complete len:616 (-),score=112.09 TRINITY_DN7978_c0_g1_i1:87-1934(-)
MSGEQAVAKQRELVSIEPRELLEAVNAARTDPHGFAARLQETLCTFNGDKQVIDGYERGTQEGATAVESAVTFLHGLAAVPPLLLSEKLTQAARDLVLDLGPKGKQGYTLSDGTKPAERFLRYGKWTTKINEMIVYGAVNAYDAVSLVIICDGDKERTNRSRLFDPVFRVAGLCSGPHATNKNVTSFILTEDFAAKSSEAPQAPFGTPYKPIEAKELLDEINAVRTNPADFAAHMEHVLRNFQDKKQILPGYERITAEGLVAVDDAIAYLRGLPPVPAVSLSEQLSLAARDVVTDLGPKGGEGNLLSDGTKSADRFSRYGTWKTKINEVTIYGSLNAFDAVAMFVVSDGDPKRTNRPRLFDHVWGVTGIFSGPHSRYGNMTSFIFTAVYLQQQQQQPRTAGGLSLAPIKETKDYYFLEVPDLAVPTGGALALAKRGPFIEVLIASAKGQESLIWEFPFDYPFAAVRTMWAAGQPLVVRILKETLRSLATNEETTMHQASLPAKGDAQNVELKRESGAGALRLHALPCKFDAEVTFSLHQEEIGRPTLCIVIVQHEGDKVTKTTHQTRLPFPSEPSSFSFAEDAETGGVTATVRPPARKQQTPAEFPEEHIARYNN